LKERLARPSPLAIRVVELQTSDGVELALPTRIATMERLKPIWARVFHGAAEADDNFFALGGTPEKARELFDVVEKECGRKLPVFTVMQAPTLRELADLLETPDTPEFPTVTLLREGREEPAIFITHGLGSNVLELYQTVKHLDISNPVYGIQAKGSDLKSEPLRKVADMADFFMAEIQKTRPHGPYFLAGYSFGGVVMFETARRLTAKGERVAFLGMIESYPYRDFLSGGQKLRIRGQLLKRHATILSRIPMREKIVYLKNGTEREAYTSWDDRGNPGRRPPNVKFADADRRRQGEELALKSYKPEFFDGKVYFVRAEDGIASFPASPRGAWGPWVREIATDVTPGDHFRILSHEYKGLAAILSRRLNEALSETSFSENRRRPQ
jgi:thioesterase domain-containing protein